MGALFSKPKKIEAKVIRTYEKLEAAVKACSSKKRHLNTWISISHLVFIACLVLGCIAAYLYIMKEVDELKVVICV